MEKDAPLPEESATRIIMDKVSKLLATYSETKDPAKRESIMAEVDKAQKELEHAFDARMQAIRKKATDDLTASLRAAFKTLGGHARKQYGDAVAEDLLAWGNETNVDALAEWLENAGWAELDKRTEHAAKVETAFAAAWTAADLLPFSVFNPDTTNAAIIGLASTAFMVKDGKWKMPSEYSLAYPATPRGSEPPPPKETVRRVVESSGLIKPIEKFEAAAAAAMQDQKTILGLDALRVMFKTRDWIHFPFPPKDKTPAADWMLLLAMPWATERATALAERLERQKTAAALEDAPRVKVKGRDFRRLPKVAAGISWAFGGSGVELSRVTVDGKEYAPAPDLAVQNPSALVPASYALLPEDHAKKAHQTLLPIDLQGGQDAPPLPVALAGATQYALAPAAGKLGLLVMAAAWAVKGKLHKTTLRDLTRAINPDAAKLVTSHFETVTRGLVQLDGLRLVLPNGMSYRVYECPIPWRELKPEEYDTPLFIGMTRTFEKTLAAISEMAGTSYRGDFLFDLTGAMMLPTKRSGLLRQYIRSCAFWNAYWKPGTAGEKDPSRVPEVSAERWAAMTNYLPPAAVEYLRANGKDRFRLSHSIRDTIKDAEDLAAAGLVKIDKANRHSVRLLPPPEYLEAWHESRKGAARMPGNAGDGK